MNYLFLLTLIPAWTRSPLSVGLHFICRGQVCDMMHKWTLRWDWISLSLSFFNWLVSLSIKHKNVFKNCLLFLTYGPRQRYLIYYNIKQRKATNTHIWEAGTSIHLIFLLEKNDLNCWPNYQNRKLTFDWSWPMKRPARHIGQYWLQI